MKRAVELLAMALCGNTMLNAQSVGIKENILKAMNGKGNEYFSDGSVKIAININKVLSYYTWASSPDTISAYKTLSTWDMAAIMAYVDEYRSMDVCDEYRRYKLWVRDVSNVSTTSLNASRNNKRTYY